MDGQIGQNQEQNIQIINDVTTHEQQDKIKNRSHFSFLLGLLIGIGVGLFACWAVFTFYLNKSDDSNVNNKNGITFESVERYCEGVGLLVKEETSHKEYNKELTCETSTGGQPIYYYEIKKEFLESAELDKQIQNLKEDSGGLAKIVKEETNYTEIYLSSMNGGVKYYIIDSGKVLIASYSSLEEAQMALNIMRGSEEIDEETSIKQRDYKRRADLNRFVSMVEKYQTNNRGALPGSPESSIDNISVTSEDDAGGSGTWSGFYHDYLGKDFIDPNGKNYSLFISKCNADTDKQCSNITALNNLYKIGRPDNVIYVVLNSKCNGIYSVGSRNPRNFAVLYYLEETGVYCVSP